MISLLGLFAAGSAEVHEVWVLSPGRAALGLEGVWFVEGERDGWRAYHATDDGLARLSDAGLPWVPAAKRKASGYRTPEEMVADLESLAAAHPDRVRLLDVGRSLEDRPIIGLSLSTTDEPAASWRILGAHHGDELPTGELVFALANALLEAYEVDPEITRLLDDHAVVLVPHVNPDGLARLSRYSASGVDLNRNYGHAWQAETNGSGAAPFSEPETRAIRTLSQWNPFHAGLSLHAGTTNIGWVWNHTTARAPDSDLLESIATRYAAQIGATEFWITNGADWYLTSGDTTDWSYGRLGTFDFTVEVSQDKSPPIAALPSLIQQHIPAMLDFLTAPLLVTGQLTDADTGAGLRGTITLDGQPMHTGPQGHFSRVVSDADPWQVTAQAPGYMPRSVALSAGAAGTLQLQSSALSQARPVPALISGADARFVLTAEQVTLTLPGEEPVVPERDGITWHLDTAHMPPGAWTLEADGAVTPRGLLIASASAGASIESVTRAGELLWVHGADLGRGSQAFALVGLQRTLLPLDVHSERPDAIAIAVKNLSADEPVDVILVTAGDVLPIHDALGTPLFFTASDAAPLPGEDAHATCAAAPLPAAWSMIVLPLGLFARRQT